MLLCLSSLPLRIWKDVCFLVCIRAWPSCFSHPWELYPCRKLGFSSSQPAHLLDGFPCLSQLFSNTQLLWLGWFEVQLDIFGLSSWKSTTLSLPSKPCLHHHIISLLVINLKKNHHVITLHIMLMLSTKSEGNILAVFEDTVKGLIAFF